MRTIRVFTIPRVGFRLEWLVCAVGISLAMPPAWSQDFVLDGNYDCARATNGKAYCRQVGKGANYFPVSDEFLTRFNNLRAGGAAPQSITQQQQNVTTNVNNTVVIQALTNDAAEIRGLLDLYGRVIAEQKEVASRGGEGADAATQAIAILADRTNDLKKQFAQKTTELSKYNTSIKPNDPDLQISARKASELYPKVPWYIPGTPETGEFWIEPFVNDTGILMFNLKFVDPSSANEKVRASVPLSATELDRMQKALLKMTGWSKTAHEKHIRRAMTKRVDCFPDANCPAEGQKRDGVASTEIIFEISEDGATSGRVQRNKGKYDEGYNISMDSAIWLQAYLKHVLNEGKSEFETGSQSTEELKQIFK